MIQFPFRFGQEVVLCHRLSAAQIQHGDISVQPAGAAAAYEESLVALQFWVTVDGASQDLARATRTLKASGVREMAGMKFDLFDEEQGAAGI
jgi:hypothetical protein